MKPELIEGKDFYFNEKGLITFTEHYHLNRGHCCGSGCRHCPFDYVDVPEPKRHLLLQKRIAQKDQRNASQKDN
jgi:2-iminoacetate synthase ThiH